MSVFWRRELAKLGVFSLLGLFIWLVEGLTPALFFLCGVLFLGNLFHLRNLAALTRWLQKSPAALVPQSSGSWEELSAGLYRMLRGTRQSQDQLSATLARFQEAAAAMPDGVMMLDENDRIEWCNPKAERHFGLEMSMDRGSQITYLVRQPEFAVYLNARHYSEPLILRAARNTELTLSVQLVPYSDQHSLVISRDITQWEKAETARGDFVANVSHELRTPLTVVGGFLETLADMEDNNPKVVRRSIELMREQTMRMRRLVEDLLTLSKLESGPATLTEEHIDMQALISTLVHEGEQLSRARHRFRVDIVAEQRLLGSVTELHSAFGNLVSNAVRYTPSAGEIHISWKRDNDQGVFAVEDTGFGIAHEHIPRLTERFYRIDRSRSRETGGTGLGLAIVKHVLNRHQAKLEITSQVGKGSRFAAVFPRRRLITTEKARALALE